MKRKSFLTAAMVLASAMLAVGCGGTFTSNTYSGLSVLSGTYIGVNEVRNAECAPRQPEPDICLDQSYKPMRGTYDVLSNGTSLLALYIETGSQDTKTQLTALTAQIAKLIADLLLEQYGSGRAVKRAHPNARATAAPGDPTAAEVRALMNGVDPPVNYAIQNRGRGR